MVGQVTLDNCGYNFTTEAHRVSRRQYGILDSSAARTGLSNELVAYDTPGEAAKAVSQWYRSAARCPKTPFRSGVAGVGNLLMKVRAKHRDMASLPVRDNAVTVESGTVAGKGSFFNASVLQAKGRFLDNVYFTTARPITVRDMAAVLHFAAITGTRLAANG